MKKIATKIFLVLMGLILITYAVGTPLLKFFGVHTIGTITDIRRQGGERDQTIRNQYNYGVGYYFILPDGQRIEGGTTVVGNSYNAGIAKGPVAVCYLKFFPRISILEKDTNISVSNFILSGVGILLIVLAFKSSQD